MNNSTVKKLSSPNGGICAVCVLICIFIISPVLFGTANLMAARMTISKTSIKQAFKESVETMQSDDIDDIITEVLPYDGFFEIGLDKEATEEMCAEMLSTMLNYYLTGEGDVLDKKAITSYLKKNSDEIEEATGMDYDDFIEEIEDQIDELNEEMAADEDNEFWAIEEMAPIRAIMSDKVFFVMTGILLFFMLLVFALFNKYLDKSFAYLAVTYLVNGILVLALGALTKLAFYALKSDMSNSVDMSDQLLLSLVGNATNLILICGAVVIVISIIFFVLKSIFRNMRRNKELGDRRSDLEKALES